MSIENELTLLYQKRFMDGAAIDVACNSSEIAKEMMGKISAPFLIKSNEEYEKSCPRVVIVGKETHGWWGGKYKDFLDGKKTIDDLLSFYENFDFARKYKYRNSPFWRYFTKIRTGIFGADCQRSAVLWSNLFKFDKGRGSMIDSQYKKAVLALQGDVFQQEIKLLDPQVVIFLTGPDYDPIIKHFYPDVQRLALGDFRTREVAQLDDLSGALPKLSFRTYHPNHLKFLGKKREKYLNEILEAVKRAGWRLPKQA
jgi:hypothetical protein